LVTGYGSRHAAGQAQLLRCSHARRRQRHAVLPAAMP
jgi:hypothetical protein